MRAIQSAAIFCEVIDNYGDAGVCWRLARQLAQQEKLSVTLWVSDLSPLQRLRPALDVRLPAQMLDGLMVRQWQGGLVGDASNGALPVADLVIEAFGCKLPDAFLQAMAREPQPPVWINLEYLSAESWVESCHRLPSPHPALPLTKYFYFPGFTTGTGGLLKEASLDARRRLLQQNAAERAAMLARAGIIQPLGTQLVSLFCYPAAPLDHWFAAMQAGAPVMCVIPEGVAVDAVARFLGRPPVAGAFAVHGNLTLQVCPFLEPDDYDALLACCDLNFVRGEDSLVRAQWACRPFIWQAYAQDQSVHFDKLTALTDRYVVGLDPVVAATFRQFLRSWNGDAAAPMNWPALLDRLPALQAHAQNWQQSLSGLTELAQGLAAFARTMPG